MGVPLVIIHFHRISPCKPSLLGDPHGPRWSWALLQLRVLRGMLDHILQEYKVSHVLALAAQAGVRYATKDPASYVASNVSGEEGKMGEG